MLCAGLTQVSTAVAGGLNVRDDAGVLTAADQQTIRDAAARAPDSVSVWTVKGGYTGNKTGFVSAADALVTSDNSVVVAVDTVDKFSHVAARNARLTPAATTAAKASADSSFGQGQWAAGVTAALTSLTGAVTVTRANGAPNQGGNVAPVPSGNSVPRGGLAGSSAGRGRGGGAAVDAFSPAPCHGRPARRRPGLRTRARLRTWARL